MIPQEPTNRELLIHLQYIRQGVDEMREDAKKQDTRLSAAEGDIKVLQERTPRQAGGWGAIGGIIGGLFGGFLQGLFPRG